jgi:hypothetical protein
MKPIIWEVEVSSARRVYMFLLEPSSSSSSSSLDESSGKCFVRGGDMWVSVRVNPKEPSGAGLRV